jgi:TMEM175 potassium channel family protein
MTTVRSLGRIGAFSDGVMAVAITLLVLNIQVPRGVHGPDLGDALVDLLPSLGAFVIAFALVGRFWVVHHNLFEKLRGFDQRLMLLNLGFLATIVLIPFSSELYDTYTKEPLAAAVLGGNLCLAGAFNAAMTHHSMRHDLIHEDRRAEAQPTVGLGIASVFALSVPAAFLSVHLAETLWIATVVVRYPLRRLGDRTTSA